MPNKKTVGDFITAFRVVIFMWLVGQKTNKQKAFFFFSAELCVCVCVYFILQYPTETASEVGKNIF